MVAIRVDSMKDTLAEYFILLPNPMYGTYRDALPGQRHRCREVCAHEGLVRRERLLRCVRWINVWASCRAYRRGAARRHRPRPACVAGYRGGRYGGGLRWLCGKILRIRIFPDVDGVMNEDILQVRGEILLVSQFTLHASTAKGNRPSLPSGGAGSPFRSICAPSNTWGNCSAGRYAPVSSVLICRVSLVNDGPVTIIIDSRARE